ncbi:MAG: PHB depolymerase family esterase [Asticcacaulis sp.]|uniref:extracellular catalytic domain type 1 short-chain-length polyhydroxyalkanoate depolymerase n=1 Tax=Asticcacaulis sp. TaxID=1872648 RepID=UPI0039E525B2
MYAYVPAGLTANRPLVLILPGCGGVAVDYDDETGWTKWADSMGFSLVIAETTTQYNNCFNFYVPADQERGSGEPATLIAMIDWMKTHYAVDSSRVFVTGFSGGAAMTNVMLATYPDVFAAGAPIAGIPYKCATSLDEVEGCFNGATVSAQTLGDRVRAAYSGYTGSWPRVSIWHGTADDIINFSNEDQEMQQWTNVHGQDQTPETSDTVAGYPHKIYGANLVETYVLTNLEHYIPVAPGSGAEQCGGGGSTADAGICSSLYIARWFGLDK